MKELLQPYRDGEHWLYTRLRDGTDPHSVKRRAFFNALWREYSPLASKGFPKKLQMEFHQRWWEMYLVAGMLHLELSPTLSKSDSGPDVVLDIGGQQVFVEAVAPSVGTKSDRVPEPVQNGMSEFPERECLLRLTQALTDKCRRLQDYVDSGVIPTDACVIIALSASDLNQFGTLLDGVHHAPLSVLAGVGPTVVTFGGERLPYSSRRSILQRDSGSNVDVALFEKPIFSIISGVLYSPIDLWNATLQPENSLSLFVNPSANQPIPNAFLKRFEHWVQEKSSSNETVWEKTPPTGPPYSKSVPSAFSEKVI